MSALIIDGRLGNDRWQLLADDSPLPAAGSVIVPWARASELDASATLELGVQIPNTLDVEPAWPQLQRAALIQLDFPAYGDGRAYSQARLLRQRLGFTGELRASGKAVTEDQILMMSRVGINSFVLREDQSAEACLRRLQWLDVAYQPACDARVPVRRARLGG